LTCTNEGPPIRSARRRRETLGVNLLTAPACARAVTVRGWHLLRVEAYRHQFQLAAQEAPRHLDTTSWRVFPGLTSSVVGCVIVDNVNGFADPLRWHRAVYICSLVQQFDVDLFHDCSVPGALTAEDKPSDGCAENGSKHNEYQKTDTARVNCLEHTRVWKYRDQYQGDHPSDDKRSRLNELFASYRPALHAISWSSAPLASDGAAIPPVGWRAVTADARIRP